MGLITPPLRVVVWETGVLPPLRPVVIMTTLRTLVVLGNTRCWKRLRMSSLVTRIAKKVTFED